MGKKGPKRRDTDRVKIPFLSRWNPGQTEHGRIPNKRLGKIWEDGEKFLIFASAVRDRPFLESRIIKGFDRSAGRWSPSIRRSGA